MNDWNKQMQAMTENMTKSWAEAQKSMWGNLMGAPAQAQMPAAMRQSRLLWQAAVEQSLAMQSDAARLWLEMVRQSGSPEAVNTLSAQMKGAADQMTDYQKQLWQNWFRLLESMEPRADAASAGQPFVASWNEMMQNAMRTQQEWLKSVAVPSTHAAPAPEK
jgi:hypothetical protein